MKPIPAIPHQITVGTAAQSVLDVFIARNMWAEHKRLIIYADFSLAITPPNAPLGDIYQESYAINGVGLANRGAALAIANLPAYTRYTILREFILYPGGQVAEANWNTVGVTTLALAQGVDHRILFYAMGPFFDNTVDNTLSLILTNNNIGSTSIADVHTAQAWIQSPLDLRRLPR